MSDVSEEGPALVSSHLISQASLVQTGAAWLLGFPEKASPQELLRHRFPSKIGGRPAWLNPLDIPTPHQLRCPATQKTMRFLLQIYAPVFEIDEAFHRAILLFLSPKAGYPSPWMNFLDSLKCSQAAEIYQPGGCVAFRSQMKRENDFYDFMPPLNSVITPPLLPENSIVEDPWNVQQYESTFTKSPTTEALPEGSMLFPEYNLAIQEECLEMAPELSPQETAESVNEKESGVPAEDMAMAEKMLTAEQRDFMSFEKRISTAPSQCIRYCFEEDAAPIWPNKQKPMMRLEDVPNCERCGAARRFEFQVLPQLIHSIEGVETAVDEGYDWGTIVVYSCVNSCDPSANPSAEDGLSQSYVPEFVFVQPM